MTGSPSRYSNADKHREATREVAYRKRVFKRWVADKKMRQDVADYRIAIMEEIAADYRKLMEQETPQLKLN